MAKIIKDGVTFVESANITELPAKDITYNPSNGLTKLNVQDELDELGSKNITINNNISNIETEIAVERSRINSFVALEDGSTTGDAELQDIRVKVDGTTAESAGDAVRSQILENKEHTEKAIDELKKYIFEDGIKLVSTGTEETIITSGTEINEGDVVLYGVLKGHNVSNIVINIKKLSKDGSVLFDTIEHVIQSNDCDSLFEYNVDDETDTITIQKEAVVYIISKNTLQYSNYKIDNIIKTLNKNSIGNNTGVVGQVLTKTVNGAEWSDSADTVALERINELKNDISNKIDKPSIEDNDKVPKAKDGGIEWVEQALPTDEQTKNAVNEYLAEHPVQPYDDEKINNEISNLKHIVSGTENNLRTVKVQWENGWINDETGKDADSSIINGRSIWYELEDTYITTRVISYDDTKEGYLAYRVFFYDENKNMVSKTSYKSAKNLFIISDIAPENAAYFRLKQYTPDVYDIELQYGYVESIGVVEQVEALSNTPSKSFSVIPKRNFVRPIVSIIDDDGHNQFYDIYKPYLERGVPVASAIDPVHWCGHDDRFMNWDKIYELKRLGCEFIVHGYGPWKYPNSYYPDEQSLRDFFEEIQKEFKEHGLTGWDLGVYPQGEVHSNLRSVCQEYFRGCFNVSPTDGLYYVKPPIKTYNIQRYPWINYTLDDAKSVIDETYENNGWLVLYAHSYSFNDNKKQMFSDIIDYIQEKGIEIVTNSEAMDRFQNILQIGDYYSNSTTSNCRVIGCDGTEFNYPNYVDMSILSAIDSDTSDETSKTDMKSLIESRLQEDGVCTLGKGIYYVSGVDMPDGSVLIGSGNDTVIRLLASVEDGYCVRIHCSNTIENVCFSGGHSNPSNLYVEGVDLGNRHGIYLKGNADGNEEACRASLTNIVNKCWFENFDGSCYFAHNTGGGQNNGVIMSDCIMKNSKVGINADYYTEYSKFSNVIVRDTNQACINNGGNNTFVGCTFHGVVGMLIDNTDDVARNHGHGSVIACTFNHINNMNNPSQLGNGYGIVSKNNVNGFLFSDCQMWYCGANIINSKGVVFNGCYIGGSSKAEFNFTGDYSNYLIDCIFNSSPTINITDGTKLINCYKTDGTKVTNQQDIQISLTSEGLLHIEEV